MSPRTPIHYEANLWGLNAEALSQCLHGNTPLGINTANFTYSFICQSRLMVLRAALVVSIWFFAAFSVLQSKSIFACAIIHIVKHCPFEKMRKTYTHPVVTMMANHQTSGVSFSFKKVHDATCRKQLCSFLSVFDFNRKHGSTVRTSPLPQPARTKFWTMFRNGSIFVDAGPKANNLFVGQWGDATVWFTHAVKAPFTEWLGRLGRYQHLGRLTVYLISFSSPIQVVSLKGLGKTSQTYLQYDIGAEG